MILFEFDGEAQINPRIQKARPLEASVAAHTGLPLQESQTDGENQ
jgi:hypothetical protein